MSQVSPTRSDIFVAGYHYPSREPIIYPTCVGINEPLSLTEPFFQVNAIALYERKRAMLRIPVFHDRDTADPAMLPYPDPLYAPKSARRGGITTIETEILRRAALTKVTLAAEATISRQHGGQHTQQPQQYASRPDIAQASPSVSADNKFGKALLPKLRVNKLPSSQWRSASWARWSRPRAPRTAVGSRRPRRTGGAVNEGRSLSWLTRLV